MVLCTACGFHVEYENVITRDQDAPAPDETCLRCIECSKVPKLREAYRRGFNAGLDALKDAVVSTVEKSNLRKRIGEW